MLHYHLYFIVIVNLRVILLSIIMYNFKGYLCREKQKIRGVKSKCKNKSDETNKYITNFLINIQK